MRSHLKANLHLANVDGDIVILDTGQDSYACIPGRWAGLQNDAEGRVIVADPDLADMMDHLGLLADEPAAVSRARPACPVRTAIHHPSTRRVGVRETAAALLAVRDVRKALVQPGLCDLLALAGAPEVRRDTAGAIHAARLLWALSPWLPFEGQCLGRSALLMAFLRRLGLSADWIFGVRLWPFQAHCWVQIDDTCLNDDFERLRAYTPILRL